MHELVRWLGEQLDEDEEIVREALRYVDAGWRWDAEENVALASGMTAAGERPVAITADRWRRSMIEGPGVVAHVAEWDPERVLREIAAKRDLLRFAEGIHDHHDTFTTGVAARLETTLRLFAAAYEYRPGYREVEWRP